MRQHFLAIGLLLALATLYISLSGDRRPSQTPWQDIRYGMRYAEVESLMGRPPDLPLGSSVYYGFSALSRIGPSMAAWDKEGVAVFFDKNAGAVHVLHDDLAGFQP